MSRYEQIRDLSIKVELLAPAGRREALESVLAAGADAVYLGAKQFNMRRHRSDFNFTDTQLEAAVNLAHGMNRRLYVTVNSMLGQAELPEVRDLLIQLAGLKIDALIVQDLAVLHIARELRLPIPLHASTMMNVHHVEHARALKQSGVTRLITSRDISLQAIGEIGRCADIEVECFVHGDMCVAQSGQCTMSGVLFGKSSNRGECMKPCRWDYELVRVDGGEIMARIDEGYLLAIKDLCLVQNIPEVVQAGICSMKIEGRMRDPEYLGRLVGVYRKAIDQYYASPPSFQMRVEAAEEVHRLRVRQSSTLTLLGGSSHRDCFDTSGQREPLFLSNGCTEPPYPGSGSFTASAPQPPRLPQHASEPNRPPRLEPDPFGNPSPAPGSGSFSVSVPQLSRPPKHLAEPTKPPYPEPDPLRRSAAAQTELAVCVADLDSAQAALDAGARRVYWAAEMSRLGCHGDHDESLAQVAALARRHGATVGIRTPRVTTDREWAETQWLLRRFHALDYVLVHHPGLLQQAAEICPTSRIIADFGFNLLNSAAAAFLAGQGVSQTTVSLEAGHEDLLDLAEATPLPLELLAHGPVAGMLIDHCVIALHGSSVGRKDVCRGPCRHVAFALRDRMGELRPIIADQYCRNHLLTSHDVAILPHLPAFLLPAVQSLRIEAQFYPPELVGLITRAYRRRLTGLAAGDGMVGWQEMWSEIQRQSPRPLNLGAYARSITQTRATAQVMKECRTHESVSK